MSIIAIRTIYKKRESDRLARAARDLKAWAVQDASARTASDECAVAELPVSPEDLYSLTEARREIEELCLRRAIACGSPAWETKIVASHQILAKTDVRRADDQPGFHPDWVAAHSAFHTALIDACDNPWLLKTREMLFLQSHRYRELAMQIDYGKRDVASEHRAIMEATIARDADRAVALTSLHLLQTAESIRAHSLAMSA